MNAIKIVDTYAFYQALKDNPSVSLKKDKDTEVDEIPDILIYKKDKTLYLNLEDKIAEPIEIVRLMKKYNDVEKVVINLDLTLDYKTTENYLNSLDSAEKKLKEYYNTKAYIFTKLFKILKDKVIAQFISAIYSLVKTFFDISKFIMTTIFRILKNVGKFGAKLLRSVINMIKKETFIVTEQEGPRNIANSMVYVRLHVNKEISEHQLFNSILNIQLQDLDTHSILTKTVVISKFDKLYTVNLPENFQIIKLFIVGAPFDLDINYDYNNKTRFLEVYIKKTSKLVSVSMIQDIFIFGVYILLFAAVVGVIFDFGVLTALGYGSAKLLNESILYAFYALTMKSILTSTIMSGIILAFLKSREIKKILKDLGLIRENQIILKVVEDQDIDKIQKLDKQIRDKAKRRINQRSRSNSRDKRKHKRG
ncbi:MAG: hypothetical protein QXW35_05845 [Candidatus Aenigmatarchaeota archaeon]